VSKTPVKAASGSAPAKKAAAKAPAPKPAAKTAAATKTAPPTASAPAKAPARSTPSQPVDSPAASPSAKTTTPVKTPTKTSGAKTTETPVVVSAMPGPPSRPPASNVVEMPRPARKIDPKLINVWKTKAGRELTEDELFAMPDSEYMNAKQLDFFRSRLEQQKNDLLENAGETTEHLREDTSIVPDPADRATIEEEHALELRTRDRERKLLKKISQSLARIESGDYGFCDETGEPIGLGRLLARPTATLSLEAQQRREMKQKMFGD